MRNVIIAAMATLSLSSAASAKEIAHFSFNSSNDVAFSLASLSLDDQGVLAITSKPVYDQTGAVPTIVTKQLSKQVFQKLKQSVIELADVEIQTTESHIVCMMMPMPGSGRELVLARGYDYDTDAFQKDSILVLDQKGCWSNKHVAPKEAYAKTEAEKLSAELEILGLQLLND